MLTVYRGNRAELLAQVLAAQLRLDPPDPFTQIQVVVNTWPTSRWLGEELAVHLGGVAAHLRFPFPASLLRGLVDLLLEEGDQEVRAGADPWRADRLVWPLLEELPAVAAGPDGAPLRRWLGERQRGGVLDRAVWQLGRGIADAFDDYGLYRPDLLRAWRDGADLDAQGRPLSDAQRWQPRLHAALRRRFDRDPFALRVERAIERLDGGAALPAALAGPLRLFGLSSLAPVQVRLLQALGRRLTVDLYLLTPCRDLWRRCVDRRRSLGEALALALPLEGDWLLEAPPLEARFGRLGSEFQQLLEAGGDTGTGGWQEADLFFAPATAAAANSVAAAAAEQPPGSAPPPLLAQLQEQLAEPELWPDLRRAPGDHSLEFHACPGPLRQVQIVRDRLLQRLAADPSLEPRDILVMTPDVERFAPLVAAVFGDSAATGVELPWRLTDRSQQSEAGLGRSLLALVRLAGERLTATALEALLESRPLQQRFALTPEETAPLVTTLQRCGFRWGLDGAERGGTATHSLAWAMDRLLLGLVLPATPGLAPGGTAPAEPAAPLERCGRWLHLLGRLRHWLAELRRGGSVAEWIERLRTLLDDLFGDGGSAAWEKPLLLAALDDWAEAAGSGGDLVLDAGVVAEVLDGLLAADSGRFGHRSGALTISALEPMRAIPHRVIVLMGLDADLFPRQKPRPGFHLMERQRRLGDPHPADQDRYVLLEALLSARDHLLLTWSCREERRGEELPPAAPVQQWLDWLSSRLGEAAATLQVRHPADPLERSNFLPGQDRPPASCDRRLLETRQRLERDPPRPAAGLLAGPMPKPSTDAKAAALTTDPYTDLRDWLLDPQRLWLAELGLRPAEWRDRVDDLEALELDEWERASLLRQSLADTGLLEEATAAGLDADAAALPPAAPEDWLERSRGQGRFPPCSGGILEARLLQRRWSTLAASLESLGSARRESLAWGPWQAPLRRHGDTVVVVHTASERVAHRLDLWLQLLLSAAADPAGEPPGQGIVISRSGDGFRETTRLLAPAPEAAAEELERLAELRQRWRAACWPVPPETGWTFCEAERRKPGEGFSQAASCWEGGYQTRGERESEVMALCFGAGLPAAALIDERFALRARELFDPLLEALAGGAAR